ncbi:hypothetical protein JKY72_05070 [Candidatus Gracilibacteria bacterium]|nr:hypothetical protein [Candidatus Gracilibacteria bacterium]
MSVLANFEVGETVHLEWSSVETLSARYRTDEEVNALDVERGRVKEALFAELDGRGGAKLCLVWIFRTWILKLRKGSLFSVSQKSLASRIYVDDELH